MTFDWSEDKNKELKEKRKIFFEEIVMCFQENRIVTVLKHPNKVKYPNQFFGRLQRLHICHPVCEESKRGGDYPQDDLSEQRVYKAIPSEE